MSVHLFVICRDCKEKLWIGQGTTIYSAVPETMQWLREFLDVHLHHTDVRIVPEIGPYEDELLGYRRQ